jgi:hypothetical protein
VIAALNYFDWGKHNSGIPLHNQGSQDKFDHLMNGYYQAPRDRFQLRGYIVLLGLEILDAISLECFVLCRKVRRYKYRGRIYLPLFGFPICPLAPVGGALQGRHEYGCRHL